MYCKCGYCFSEHAMEDPPAYASFAVVADEDWMRLMKLEREVYNAVGDQAESQANGKAAELVGSLYMCPECGRLVLLTPRDCKIEVYRREDTAG